MNLNLVQFDEREHLRVLDQTQLPNREEYVTLSTADEVADAIRRLKVRGAPLIGICGAMGLYVAFRTLVEKDASNAASKLQSCAHIIANARPTAVNLAWAVNRMLARVAQLSDVGSILSALKAESLLIQQEEESTCEAIGRNGNTLIADGMGILTHCNAGLLATGRYGTALAPIYAARQSGKNIHVYADETRPLLQGARLTAYELTRNGVPTTLICDNMAASVMSQGKVQMVLVGCDRVAANGDTANKIGTLGVAILARYYGIPFYVCGPRSTFDPHCATGQDIVIEQRNPEEIRSAWYAEPMAPQECDIYNPSFDVTPHELITGYIREDGIITM